MELMHVTEAIATVGLSDSVAKIDPYYLKRGEATHHGTHLIDLGRLTPESPSVHPEIKGRLQSYLDWRNGVYGNQVTFLNREVKLINPPMGLEGKLDWIGYVEGNLTVIDLKSSLNCKEYWHRFQVALYALMWQFMNPGKPTPRRACLYLDADGGRPQFVEHNDRSDFERAKAIVTVAYILKSQGRTNAADPVVHVA